MAEQPTIPFNFSPAADEYETAHLVFGTKNKITTVAWPLIGEKIIVRATDEYPDLDFIAQANGSLFKNWGNFGYSIGQYHEFFCKDLPEHAAFKLGGVEISVGCASPLAAYLFDNFHEEDYFGPWDYVTTVRIIGCSVELAETMFINAAIHYHDRYRILPEPMEMRHLEWLDTEDLDGVEKNIITLPPANIEHEPLRFHYNGLSQVDGVAACIYHYRVLEYFAFFRQHKDIGRLRHDGAISDFAFMREMATRLFRDEKGPLVVLVKEIANGEIVELAVQQGILRDGEKAHDLAARLYEFRNSIVHGKQMDNYLTPSPVITTERTVSAWRHVLELLSRSALNAYGRRHP
ncbi:hypothetical protein [Dongia sp.]|uniref:hypothetical protein n=1 Tax=Dongia sp. TaxID=1977262 RepID=UPI0035ADEE0C